MISVLSGGTTCSHSGQSKQTLLKYTNYTYEYLLLSSFIMNLFAEESILIIVLIILKAVFHKRKTASRIYIICLYCISQCEYMEAGLWLKCPILNTLCDINNAQVTVYVTRMFVDHKHFFLS